jgi:hypothetical protein
VQPASLVALLATLVLLFGFQGNPILAQPLIISSNAPGSIGGPSWAIRKLFPVASASGTE